MRLEIRASEQMMRRLWRAQQILSKDDGEVSLGETVRRLLDVGLSTIGQPDDAERR